MFIVTFFVFQLGQEMVKGRQRAYCFVWLLFTTGTDVLFLATSCQLYIDTVPLIPLRVKEEGQREYPL